MMDDCCSCHISPPCHYCLSLQECPSCSEFVPELDEMFLVCSDCIKEREANQKICECGGDKHEWAHSSWCPKYEK